MIFRILQITRIHNVDEIHKPPMRCLGDQLYSFDILKYLCHVPIPLLTTEDSLITRAGSFIAKTHETTSVAEQMLEQYVISLKMNHEMYRQK